MPYRTPTAPPAGYYDPNIDSQVGAANRGLGDTREDSGTAGRRDTSDYLLNSAGIARGAARGGEDLSRQIAASRLGYDRAGQDLTVQEGTSMRGFDRAGSDLDQRSSRGGEDYSSSVQALTRNYSRLGGSQAQSQRAAGLTGGSAALQAAARRNANQAIDRAPIDQGFSRLTQDIGTARGRLGEDRSSAVDAFGRARGRLGEDRSSAESGFATARGRLGEDTADAQGRLNLDGAPPSAENPLGGRRFQDRTVQLSRAEREGGQFGIDAGRQRFFEAAGNGYTIPQRGEPGGQPSNEFSDAAGPYQTRSIGGVSRRVNPDGSVRALSPQDEDAARRRAASQGASRALLAAQRAARRRR